jgi:hypothetical protein
MAEKLPAKKGGAWYALDTLHHDGAIYAPGDEVPTVTEAQADQLRAAGLLSAVQPVPDDETAQG